MASGAPDKVEVPPQVERDAVVCPHCTRVIGFVQGRNVVIGEAILVNRAVLRCRSCFNRIVWRPLPEVENRS